MNYRITGKPLSVNNAKAAVRMGGKLRMVLTNKARSWKTAAIWELKAQRGCSQTISAPCDVAITFYLPTVAGDVDNYAKATLDAMQSAGIIANDRQVQALTLRKMKDAANPRTEIVITS